MKFSADSQTPGSKQSTKGFGKAFRFVCLATLCDMQQTSPTKDQTYARHQKHGVIAPGTPRRPYLARLGEGKIHTLDLELKARSSHSADKEMEAGLLQPEEAP